MGSSERLRPLAIDALLAAGFFALGLSGLGGTGEAFGREPDAVNVMLISGLTLPLALRRIYPTAVFVVVVSAWIVDRGLDYPGTLAALGVVLAFHSIGTELPPRRSLSIGGPAIGLIVVYSVVGGLILESVSVGDVIFTLLATAIPLLLGREVHERRRRLIDLQLRAERAERDREERARRSVAEERARIARELHDVVAHQMTVMTLQADGARRIVDGSDPRVVSALDTIRDAGHSAFTDMRRMVGLLRTPSRTGHDVAPFPRVDQIEQLAAQMTGAGLPVRLDITGQVRPLDEGMELSVYRIVQESLTNAVRHGGPEVTAQVRIDYGTSCLDIVIDDDGRGDTMATSEHMGQGLVGMRERVAVLGGALDVGPKTSGGFRVRASIPVAS